MLTFTHQICWRQKDWKTLLQAILHISSKISGKPSWDRIREEASRLHEQINQIENSFAFSFVEVHPGPSPLFFTPLRSLPMFPFPLFLPLPVCVFPVSQAGVAGFYSSPDCPNPTCLLFLGDFSYLFNISPELAISRFYPSTDCTNFSPIFFLLFLGYNISYFNICRDR